MSLKEFVSKFSKVVVYKTISFILFVIVSFFIIYFVNFNIILKRSKEIATKNIKYSYYLLEKEYKKLLDLISYLAALNAKKELKSVLYQNNDIYALIFLDNKGNIKKIYNLKKGLYNLKSIKEYLPILKNYKRKIDENTFFVSPLYPNFLGYQNSFIVGFPYYKDNKQEGYLFAILDVSLSGLLRNVYFFLFSNLNKNSFIKYKINYNYFDKFGIKGININYEINKNDLSVHALHRTINFLVAVIIMYITLTLMDLNFAYKKLYRDFKFIISFLNKGNFQCHSLNFYFSKEICKKVSELLSKLISKDKEIDLFVDSLRLIIKENKDIKGMLKDISSLLKVFVPCQEIFIYIFDIERGMSIFSGSNEVIIKEDIFEKIRKKFKNTNIIQEDKNIYTRYIFKPFEIFYIFTNCKDTDKIYKLKDFLDIINLIIVTALKLYINSIQDPLTKAFNRQKMEYDLLENLELYKRHKDVFSILMIDIDHFKKINDTYGHDAGDMVLKSLVKTIKGSLRKGDVIYRYGGEEFIILLPRTPLKEAIKVAEKLREKIMYIRVPYKNKIITFTASFGVTQVKDSDNLNTLIKRADKALYKAKNNGRNRVEYEF